MLYLFSRLFIMLPWLLLLTFSELLTNKALTAVNKFTKLDNIYNWIIQRKINDVDQSLQCRAVLPLSGTWFGSNVRIDKYGHLIVPKGIVYSESENSKVLSDVRSALDKCRLDFIYF